MEKHEDARKDGPNAINLFEAIQLRETSAKNLIARRSFHALLLGGILYHGQDYQAQTGAYHVILHLPEEDKSTELGSA